MGDSRELKHDVSRLDLSPIDQTICRPYIRLVLCFPLPEPLCIDEERAISARLEAAFHDALIQRPELTYTLKLVSGEDLKGSLELVVPTDDEGDLYFPGKDMVSFQYWQAAWRHEGYLAHQMRSYNEMKEDGMSPRELVASSLCSLPDYPDLSRGAPVAHMAVNFIRGGLLLAFYVAHSVVDGRGLRIIIDDVARNVQQPMSSSVESMDTFYENLIGLEMRDQTRQTLDKLASACPSPCPEFCTTPRTPRTPGKPDGAILVFSHQKLEHLQYFIKSWAHREHRTPDGNDDHESLEQYTAVMDRISIFDTLAAVLWVSISCARERVRGEDDELAKPETQFGFAVDTRPRLKLAKDFIGNGALYTVARMSTSLITRDEVAATFLFLLPKLANLPLRNMKAISDAAYEIRKANLAFDASAISARIRYLMEVKEPGSVEPSFNTEDNDLFMTSWADLGSNADFGTIRLASGTSNQRDVHLGMPEFLRKPWSTFCDGGIIILPRGQSLVEEAAYEVFVTLRPAVLQQLRNDYLAKDVVTRWID
jgi:hypothetical protein